jgi:hypothetical protein
MARITQIEEARKLAASVVGDVAFYSREKIRQGLKADSLFEAIADELAEARAIYAEKVEPELEQQHNLFNRAVVDIIIKPFADEETTIW